MILGAVLGLAACGNLDAATDAPEGAATAAPAAASAESTETIRPSVPDLHTADEEATIVVPGEPRADCFGSTFDCNLHGKKSFRVTRYDSNSCNPSNGPCTQWSVHQGLIRDGFGNWTGNSASGGGKLGPTNDATFNYGLLRNFPGLGLYAMESFAGWFPVSSVVKEDLFKERVGRFYARNPGAGHMDCYETYAPSSPSADQKDAEGLRIFPLDSGMIAWDTPPESDVASNYLGGNMMMDFIATDLIPKGTTFRRLKVPTYQQDYYGAHDMGGGEGRDSIRIALYENHSSTQVGWLEFYYGFVPTRKVLGYDSIGWVASKLQTKYHTYDYLTHKTSGWCPEEPIEEPESGNVTPPAGSGTVTGCPGGAAGCSGTVEFTQVAGTSEFNVQAAFAVGPALGLNPDPSYGCSRVAGGTTASEVNMGPVGTTVGTLNLDGSAYALPGGSSPSWNTGETLTASVANTFDLSVAAPPALVPVAFSGTPGSFTANWAAISPPAANTDVRLMVNGVGQPLVSCLAADEAGTINVDLVKLGWSASATSAAVSLTRVVSAVKNGYSVQAQSSVAQAVGF